MTGFLTGTDRKKQGSRGFDPILLFFLKLYKLQLGADPSAESRVELAPRADEASEVERTCTLRVNHEGIWRSRRVTLGRLGANIANKSTCYRVIFDDQMVVKVPPQPISEFNAYIDCIRRDGHIAQKAAPSIRCIIPSLSALFNKIPQLSHPEVQSPEEIEKRHIFLLRKDPGLQNYLKIGDSFVFFMSLARYPFLNQQVEKIHEHSLPAEELLKPSDPLWETHGIDSLHMAKEEAVVFEMGQVLAEYEERIADLMESVGRGASVSVLRRRTWLCAHLSGQKLETEDTKLPEELARTLPGVLSDFSEKHRAAIEAFRAASRQRMEKTWVDRNRGKIRRLIESTVALLARLKSQNLAVRDLKPENIFIETDPESLEQTPKDPEAFDLGLIDLETALVVDTNPEAMEQPLCTGTPAYSTPSHLFPNPLLKEMVGNLKQTFFLQDAYAAAGLIFFAATGETLFEKTGRLLPEIVLASQKSSLRDRTPPDLFRHASWVFWNSAADELRRQRAGHQDFLRTLVIALSQGACSFFREILDDTGKDLASRISFLLSSQSFLQEAQVKSLAASDARTLARRIRQLELKSAGANSPLREQVLSFLASLQHLKRMEEHGARYRKKMAGGDSLLSVDDLIGILFLAVIAFMYRESWNAYKHPAFPDPPPAG